MKERKRRVEKINAERVARNQTVVNPTADPTLPFSHITLLPGGNNAELVSTGKMPGYYDADQLYDLEADPNELKNLADNSEYKKILDEMKTELRNYIDNLPGGFPL